MLAALALAAVVAQPGTTYSQVAANAGVSVSAIEALNPWAPTAIPVGVTIHVPGTGSGLSPHVTHSAVKPASHTDGDGDHDGDSTDSLAPSAPVVHHHHSLSPSSVPGVTTPSVPVSHAPVVHHNAPVTPSSGGGSSSGSGGGSITNIPGVPSSFVKCVAFRESGNGSNQAFNGGVYGIINASGQHVNGQPLSVQKQAFATIYHTTGPSAWAADHCPGT